MDITGLSSIFDFASGVLNRIFPDPKDRLEAAQKLEELRQNGELAKLASETDLMKGQLEINKIEAGSTNLFISGARPFFLWVCGVAFAYTYIIQPLFIFLAVVCGLDFDYHKLPTLDWENMMAIALPLLGIGTLRTAEKIKGVASK